MAGAYTALATDAAALGFNPAGLARLEKNEAMFMHDQHFESVTQDLLSVAVRPGYGFSAQALDYGSFDRTTYSSPGGGLGAFSVSDLALSAGGARAFGPLALGAAGKWIRESNDGTVASGVAADVGALWDVAAVPGLSLGASGRNLGGSVRFQSGRELLPSEGRFGAAWTTSAGGVGWTASADAVQQAGDRPRGAAGFEAVVRGVLSLRAGWTSRNDAGLGWSAGVGWRGPVWSADYALVPYGDLGLVQRLGVTVRWGGAAVEAAKARWEKASHDSVLDLGRRAAKQAEPPRAGYQPPGPDSVGDAGLAAAPPPSVETRLAVARRMVDAGRLDDARRALDSLDASLPADDRLRVPLDETRGRLLRESGDLKGAREAYSDALRLAIRYGQADQTVSDAYKGMGLTLAAQGNFEYAAKFLSKAYELSSDESLPPLIRDYERRARSAR
jgi:hypothetical protein